MHIVNDLTLIVEPLGPLRKYHSSEESSKTSEEPYLKDSLEAIRQYIDSNVQSQRRNILTLYSNTINHSRQAQNLWGDEPIRLGLKEKLRRHRLLGPIQKAKKDRFSQLGKEKHPDDTNMIISNKFSQKQRKQKSLLPRTKRQFFNASQTKYTAQTSAESPMKPPSPRIQIPKIKPPVPELPAIRIKTKKIKNRRKQHIASEINPWEYLIIPDQPYPDCLEDRQLLG